MFTIGSKNMCFIFRCFCKYELKNWFFKKKGYWAEWITEFTYWPRVATYEISHVFLKRYILIFCIVYQQHLWGIWYTPYCAHHENIPGNILFFMITNNFFIYLLTEVVNTSSSSASNGNFTDIVFSLILPRKFSFLRILWRKQGELTKIVRSQMANSSRLSRDICPRSVACSCN